MKIQSPVKVYGIKNCQTVQKSINWLVSKGLEVDFHDFKKKGIDRETLNLWADEFGWEKLVNKRGTTWRKLSPEQQNSVIDKETAIDLMLEHHSVIKRPIVEVEATSTRLLGFDEEAYQNTLAV